ncbi:MAG: hypothetical protein CM15mP4_3390 [Candidatus Neomarinimicrobiota bacterium]|nr:MAG: hypothetical protein CM15mP4_3390 [Candidatus Neomarinimicrobiota bacterium]
MLAQGKKIVAILSRIAVGKNFCFHNGADRNSCEATLLIIHRSNEQNKSDLCIIDWNMKKKGRTSIISGIKSNKIQIIIGTMLEQRM